LDDEKSVTYTPKKDRYSRARGAPQFLDLFCANCRGHLMLYQKDGLGALKRLYLDRIFAPGPFSSWQASGNIADVPNLVCPHCGRQIGVPMMYRPENRPAIRLIPGTFSKVRSNGAYPPPQASER
jgi:hypothetical protein